MPDTIVMPLWRKKAAVSPQTAGRIAQRIQRKLHAPDARACSLATRSAGLAG